MSRLVVRANQTTFICLVILAVFFGLMSLGNLSQLRHGFRVGPLVWAFVPVAIFAPVLWLTRRGHSRSVRVFTEDGLTRNDGYRQSWTDLDYVIEQLHRFNRLGSSGVEVVWRIEIHFKNGECAWLIPNKIANREEVLAYIAALPCEYRQVRV